MNSLKPYPSVAQSWGIFGIAVLSMFVFIPVNQVVADAFGQGVGLLVYYVLTTSTPFIIAHFLRKKISGITSYSIAQGLPLIYLLLIPAMVAIQIGITMPIAEQIPMPEFVKEMFSSS